MDKDNFIQITNDIYRISVLFPKKEPLRYKLREIADNILSDLITWDAINSVKDNTRLKEKENLAFSLNKNLSILDGYFDIAKWQNWVSFFDILEIQEKCAKIGAIIEKNKDKKIEQGIENDAAKPVIKEKEELDERKQKILEVLKNKEKTQVWEVNELFPKISKRTIRRDFAELLSKGLIERMGQRNNTFYQIKMI